MVTQTSKPKRLQPAGSQGAGRHRETGQRAALPLILSDQDGPEETIHIAFPDRLGWPRQRNWRYQVTRVRQPMAWIVAACVVGGFTVWGFTGTGSGGTTVTSHSPAPLPAMLPAPVTLPDATSRPRTTSSPGRPNAASHKHQPRRGTATGQPATGQPAQAHPGTVAASTPAATATRTSQPSPGPRGAAPAVVVTYHVDAVSDGGFQGEVDVVNNGRQPLAGWQIVVALEGDQATGVRNATGFDSNGILLMQPVNSAEVVPPNGGTLRVFFAAQGPRTEPLACAFNNISCQ